MIGRLALMRCVFACAILSALGMGFSMPAFAQTFLVKDGQPRAEIVISGQPPRMVKLAALELQTCIEKISGARLAITNVPGTNGVVHVYVGRSAHTDRLGITDDGLADGAFRMVSGKDFLVLLGTDHDFLPKEPWARNSSQIPAMLAEWDKLTGATWGNAVGGPLHREYSRAMDLWAYDERGSLNAVYEFLRGLGVRWYMAGELGEILSRRMTIVLPGVDKVVVPVVALRRMTPLGTTYSSLNRDDMLWQFRLGLNAHCRKVGTAPHLSHGLADVLTRPEMKAAHPEYYALIGGRRDTNHNHACLSSEGLFQEAVRFARAMFDVYDAKTVSLMPEDGFTFCECDLCKGKDTPKRGRKGMYSDYVWGFVDRVAREVYKTHPDRTINCLAYGTSELTPETIGKLSPNVVVGMIHARRDFDDPATRDYLLGWRRAWREKSDPPFWGWEHYPFTHLGTFTPVYFPRAIAEGLRSMRGEYFGEKIECAWGPAGVRGHGLHEPGFNHLNIYVTARFQWDPDQDLDTLLEEYYRLFYGPAAAEMRAFVAYSEGNRLELQRDIPKIDRVLALLDAAAAKVDPKSDYGRRVELVAAYLQKLREWRGQLARGREDVPVALAPARAGAALAFDGRLDDAIWQDLPAYPLVDLATGREPAVGSWFKLYWDGGDRNGCLVIGIRCHEPDMAHLRLLTKESGNWRVLDGDSVEIMLETQSHSYYQLAINAAGALLNLDRNYGRLNTDWSSQAKVAAHQGKDFWSIEARIPVTGEEKPGDPLHELAGWRPTAATPWHINVCRQRLRGDEEEQTLWSPAKEAGKGFHDVMRFGRLE